MWHNPYRLRSGRRRLIPRAAILAYHRVADAQVDPYGQAVTPATFERQLHLLKREYVVESLEGFLEKLPQRAYPDGTIVITFDDGYADILSLAYPIAASLDIPLTLFVAAQPVLEGGAFWWDELAHCLLVPPADATSLTVDLDGRSTFAVENESDRRATLTRLHAALKRTRAGTRQRVIETVRAWAGAGACSLIVGRPMRPAELQEFASLPGVTIGSHTLTHPMLSALSAAEQLYEMVASKASLERILGRSVRLIAYPFGKPGDISRETPSLAQEAGYRAAFTTTGGSVRFAARPFALPRMTVHNWSEDAFARRLHASLEGWRA